MRIAWRAGGIIMVLMILAAVMASSPRKAEAAANDATYNMVAVSLTTGNITPTLAVDAVPNLKGVVTPFAANMKSAATSVENLASVAACDKAPVATLGATNISPDSGMGATARIRAVM